MSVSSMNEATVREAVRGIIAPMSIDKIIGQPTNTTVTLLKQQIAKIAAAVKTTKWGGRHGHLALVINETDYRTVTAVATANVDPLDAPPLIPVGLVNNMTITDRTRITATHAIEQQEYWKQEAVNAIIVERIVGEIVDATYVEELEDDYIGYSAQTIKTLLSHITTEWCTVTTLEKKQALEAFNVQWDLTSHITKFARELDKQQKICIDIGVTASTETKIQYYVENMYVSEMFDDKEMRAWENKTTANKTWTNAKTYFVELYRSKAKFNEEREARQGGYESANSLRNRTEKNNNEASVNSFGNNLPNTQTGNHPNSIMAGSMSSTDQSTMIEYTNSIEGALTELKEHIAILQTTQEKTPATIGGTGQPDDQTAKRVHANDDQQQSGRRRNTSN